MRAIFYDLVFGQTISPRFRQKLNERMKKKNKENSHFTANFIALFLFIEQINDWWTEQNNETKRKWNGWKIKIKKKHKRFRTRLVALPQTCSVSSCKIHEWQKNENRNRENEKMYEHFFFCFLLYFVSCAPFQITPTSPGETQTNCYLILSI